jgi:hypothetical protein
MKFLRRSFEPLPEEELKDLFFLNVSAGNMLSLVYKLARPLLGNHVCVSLLSLNQFEVFFKIILGMEDVPLKITQHLFTLNLCHK